MLCPGNSVLHIYFSLNGYKNLGRTNLDNPESINQFYHVRMYIIHMDSIACWKFRLVYYVQENVFNHFLPIPRDLGVLSRLCFPWEEEQGTAPLALFK